MTPNGYSYSEAATASSSNIQQYYLGNTKMQSFDQSSTDIYNLTTGMEMIEFPPKNLLAQQHFFNKPTIHNPSGLDPSSSTKAIINEPSDQSGTEFYQPMSDHPTTESSAWSDQSLRCIFPCEGNEKPSQGLSLSLSSSNPSRIGLQSFELRQQHDDWKLIRDGFFDKSINIQDGFLGKNGYLHYSHGSLRSKYLVSAQELLNEFCNLPDVLKDHSLKGTLPSKNQWKDDKKAPLNSLDLLELQKRKTRLLQMLEEVDRRYNNYSNQMKSMVSSFEAVAGNGAAKVYSALASKAMSRHFRCLRDEIVSEIKSTKKAMGEKDINSSPATRGETPRLRILDQTLRQQRAFQQMNMMETHPWRPLRGLPERSVSVLRAWLFEHFLHPYPSDVDKHILSRQTGLSRSQVSNWFINARVRLWKPMVEEMYIQEMKDQENTDSLDGQGGAANLANLDDDHHENVGSQNPHTHNIEDQKPTLDQLVRIDSESLSSIINTDQENSNGKNDKGLQEIRHPRDIQQHHDFSLGAMEMDFSSYNHSLASGIHYGIQNPLQNYGGRGEGGGTGVSLTLGLQQHGGSGVSLAFSSASQNSLLYTRDHIDQHIQYSLLDNEGQDLQYRNLMSSQMLHDLG